MNFEEQSDILKALGHPVRLRIVRGLIEHECNVTKIVEKLRLPQSTVSQHLTLLRRCGIIRPTKEGVITCYRVVDARVQKILRALEG